MAMLFRPWAEEEKFLERSTLDTTTNIPSEIKCEKPNDSAIRETKFNSVKEHMRKRSEKKHKRLRSDIEVEDNKALSQSSLLPVFANNHPSVCLPSYPLPISFPHNALPKECWDDLSLASPELLEVAFAQGLPPGLVEEYARLLTQQQREISERNRKQRPKKFRCPHCNVGFSNNGQLKGHIRIHTGERPFKCDAEDCGKSFTRNEELTRHRRIHSGLRPFPCPECGKRFGRKDHLKKHVRTHFQQRYQLVPIYPSQYPFLFPM